jgi:hypothetical protein
VNGGRTVLVLRASNIVEEHDEKIHISYEFPQSKMIVEPLMVVGAFMVLFVLGSLFSRATAIGSKSKEE